MVDMRNLLGIDLPRTTGDNLEGMPAELRGPLRDAFAAMDQNLREVINRIEINQTPEIDASQVISGTLNIARIPNIPAEKVEAGTFGLGNFVFEKNSGGVKSAAPFLIIRDLDTSPNASCALFLVRSNSASQDWSIENNAGVLQLRYRNNLTSIDQGTSVADFNSAYVRFFSTQVFVPDGTEELPGLAFGADQDVGLYRYGTGDIAISCGNLRVFTVSDNAPYAEIRAPGNDVLRIVHTSSTGSPMVSFYQSATRRAYAQYLDDIPRFIFNSEEAGSRMEFHVAGAERLRLHADGTVEAMSGDVIANV